jgi:hypothetical protein
MFKLKAKHIQIVLKLQADSIIEDRMPGNEFIGLFSWFRINGTNPLRCSISSFSKEIKRTDGGRTIQGTDIYFLIFLNRSHAETQRKEREYSHKRNEPHE